MSVKARLSRLERCAGRMPAAGDDLTIPAVIRRLRAAGVAFELWPWVCQAYAESRLPPTEVAQLKARKFSDEELARAAVTLRLGP